LETLLEYGGSACLLQDEWGGGESYATSASRVFGLSLSPRLTRQAQECRLYSALAGKGDGQGHRGLLGSVSALQRVVVGNNHLGGRCGGLGCGLVTQATL